MIDLAKLFPDLISWFDRHSGLAGWAQAVGATIAIFLSWYLARSEVRATRHREVDQLKMALFLLAEAFDHLARANRGFEDPSIVVPIATKLLANAPLRHARESMIRAEERGGLPTAAMGALVASGADISRALDIVNGISSRTAPDKVPAFGGAVGTLRNRIKALAALVERRGGRYLPGDPNVLIMWLKPPLPIRINNWLHRRTTGSLMRWALTTDSWPARVYRRRVLKLTLIAPLSDPDLQ